MTFPRLKASSLLRGLALSAVCVSLGGCLVIPDDGPRRHYQSYKTYPTHTSPPAYRYYPGPTHPPSYRPSGYSSGYSYRPAPYASSYSRVSPVATLPYGASRVVIRGESCWFHNGHYYRRHPSGFVLFIP